MIERARAQINDVLQRAEMDEIYLPTVSSGADGDESELELTG